MLNIIQTEFMKMKRQKFIIYSLLTAFILPIPITIITRKNNMQFHTAFTGSLFFMSMIFLPCVLGIIAAVLFYTEQESNTLKNLLIVPVTKCQLILAKLVVLIIISMTYMIFMFMSTLLGGLFLGGISEVLECFSLSIVAGILGTIAILPMIFVIIATRKGYVVSVSMTLIYVFSCFVIIETKILTPISAVLQLIRPYMRLKTAEEIESILHPAAVNVGFLLLVGTISIISSIIVFIKQDA